MGQPRRSRKVESFRSICEKYPNEFLVLEVTEMDELGQPSRARVLVHANTEEEAFVRARDLNKKGLTFFYNITSEELEGYSIIM